MRTVMYVVGLLVFSLTNEALFAQKVVEQGTAEWYTEMGFRTWKAGDYARAVNLLDTAVMLNAERSWTYYRRAEAKYSAGDYEGAIQDYGEAIAREPSSRAQEFIDYQPEEYLANLYCYRADAKVQLSRFQEAAEDLEQALGRNDRHLLALDLLGLCRRNLQDYIGAVAAYTHAILISPDAVRYCWRGWSWAKQGYLTNAVEDLDKAIALDKDLVDAYFIRGVIRVKHLGDVAGGCEDLYRAEILGYVDKATLSGLRAEFCR